MSMMKTRWHPQYAACQGCARVDRPHIAKGYCETCYRKARAAERRQAEARGETLPAPPLRNIWHHDHAACLGCGGTIRPHLADGLCVACYRARHVPGDRGHEELPRYQPTFGPLASPNASQPCAPDCPDTGIVVDLASRRAAAPQQTDSTATGPQPSSSDGQARPQGGTVDPALSGERPFGAFGQVAAPTPPAAPVAAHYPAPRLFARHIRLIRTYAITCPNCGEIVRNSRTGGETFPESELPSGTEIACGCCGARWGITLE